MDSINPEEQQIVETAVSPAKSINIWETVTIVILLLILALAAYFRFSGLNWDANYHLHPDERFLTIVGSSLDSVPDPITYLKTSESTLNPYNAGQTFFVYGNFPMTVTVFVSEWAANLCTTLTDADGQLPGWCISNFTSYDGIHLIGRFMSGLLDLVSVIFVFLIGWRLYDRRVGLLAALLHAVAVMPIQQSHFFTMDNWAAALTTMTVYAAVRAAGFGDEDQKWRPLWWMLFGIGLGTAAASRINVAIVAGLAPLAAIVWLARKGHTWKTVWNGTTSFLKGKISMAGLDMQRMMLGVMIAALISIVTFRFAQPYAFADAEIVRTSILAETGEEPGLASTIARSIFGFNPQWRSNMEEIQYQQVPDFSAPFALQWTDRAPILFPLTNMILYGMGLTAGIAAWAGFLWALWRIAKGKPDWVQHAIPVAWAGVYFLFIGTRWVKSIRYFLPIYPVLFLLAGWALFAIWDRMKAAGNGRFLKKSFAALLIVATVLPSFLWANTFITTYTTPFTRIRASEWIFDNIPSGAALIYEANGQQKTVQLPLKQFQFTQDGTPLNLFFEMPEDGTVTAVSLNYLSLPPEALPDDRTQETFRASLNANGNFVSGEDSFTLSSTAQSVLIPLPNTAVSGETIADITVELVSAGPVTAKTSVLMVESWDDILPVGINGRNAYGSYYDATFGGPRPITDFDSNDKRQQMIEWLEETDYIILSSQRAMWSQPRIPLSYPMMMVYYESLFDGALGFELAGEFHADFRIGPLYISDTTGQIGWSEPPFVGFPPPGDLAAEEAFSIYDHPPVWVFKKTDQYSRENTVELLGRVDLNPDQVRFMTPREAENIPNGLMLSSSELAVQQANGTFSQVFEVDGILSTNPTVAAVVWWITAVILGWLAFPLAALIFRGLPDKGYALARILSLLLISYFGWMMASLNWLPNSRSTYLLGMLLVGILSVFVFVRRRVEIISFVRSHLRYIGFVELLAVALYLIAIGIRVRNPDLWDVIWGGEKPMDLSYYTAVLKSTTFPPYDPWYAGGYLNYYYYGFVYVGALTKLLGIVPALSYNLSLALLFSFTGLGAFAVAYNLAAWNRSSVNSNQSPITDHQPPITDYRSLIAGTIAAIFAVILGNLAQLGVMMNAWYRTGTNVLNSGIGGLDAFVQTLDGGIRIMSGQPAGIYPGDWFWTATRAINANPGEAGPITEFPFFTFLYGDLHAHMISLPLTMLALGWAVSLVLQAATTKPQRSQRPLRFISASWWETTLQWLIGAIAIGVLQATNIWDLPTYAVIGVMAVVYAAYWGNGRSWTLNTIGQAILQAILLIGLALLAFWPFSSNFGAGFTTLEFWQGSHTHLSNYLTIHGVFLFFMLTHLLREFRAWTKTWTESGLREWEPLGTSVIIALILYIILLIVLVYSEYYVAPVALTLLIIAGLLGLRRDLPSHRRIVLILISSALGISLFVEFYVVAGTVGRMNTVFKFYMQVWMMLSVLVGVTAVWAWPSIRKQGSLRTAWQVAVGVLVFLALLYPFQATGAKWDIRMNKEAPITLNGMEFMQFVEYGDVNNSTVPLRFDYDAIQWMHRNIDGSPVIAEAYSNNYYRSAGNRIAMFTGLPSIIGWAGHQNQQRAAVPGNKVDSRINDVRQLYNTTQIQEALNIIDKYNVGYVYVGQLEWVNYTPDGLNKFDTMVDQGYLEEVYRNEGTSIYKVLTTEREPLAVSN